MKGKNIACNPATEGFFIAPEVGEEYFVTFSNYFVSPKHIFTVLLETCVAHALLLYKNVDRPIQPK